MSAIDPKILSKIKKCLALSGSPNPHEAAVAMRQAHALMRQHGVDVHHVTMSEIGESTADIRTMSRDKPANWEAALAATVGKAFGCQMLISRTMVPKKYRHYLNEGQFIFIGQKGQAEVAAYTVAVLSRKCKTARQKWIAEHLSGLGTVRGGKPRSPSWPRVCAPSSSETFGPRRRPSSRWPTRASCSATPSMRSPRRSTAGSARSSSR